MEEVRDLKWLFHDDYWRQVLKTGRPILFKLYSAAWRAGYTVNGIEPQREDPPFRAARFRPLVGAKKSGKVKKEELV